jgi:hypothetical protein
MTSDDTTEMEAVAADELSEADGEAAADTASFASWNYQGRKAWKPGNCIGFIINTVVPVHWLKWPKGLSKKEFFKRIDAGADRQQNRSGASGNGRSRGAA